MSGPWLWLPLVGPIRISTVLAAIGIVAVILWRRPSPLLALVTVMAWTAVFEIAFNATGTLLRGWSLSYLAWLTAALGGWVLLSVLLAVLPNRWLLIAVAAVWVVWVATGFDSNAPAASGPGHPSSFSVTSEVLNELAKSLLAIAYVVGALRRDGAAHAAGRFGITLSKRWASMPKVMDSPSASGRWHA